MKETQNFIKNLQNFTGQSRNSFLVVMIRKSAQLTAIAFTMWNILLLTKSNYSTQSFYVALLLDSMVHLTNIPYKEDINY